METISDYYIYGDGERICYVIAGEKATEELSKSVNINYFNTLLEKEKLTPYELDVVGQYIAKSNDIISDAINTEIAR